MKRLVNLLRDESGAEVIGIAGGIIVVGLLIYYLYNSGLKDTATSTQGLGGAMSTSGDAATTDWASVK